MVAGCLEQHAARGVVFSHVSRDHVRIGKVALQGRENAILRMGAGDRSIVVAVAALAVTGTTYAVVADHGVAGAAAAAFGEAGQQVPGLGSDGTVIVRAFGFARSAEAEDAAIDDRQVRDFGTLPFRFRIET
nr:hypothetical protein [Devosia submarina]